MKLLDAAQRQAITHALALTEGNVLQASEVLGCHRQTTYNLMKKYGLDPWEFRAPAMRRHQMSSRYDMNSPDGAGRIDFGLMSADDVDHVIEQAGGELRLDRLMKIAEDAGVAADEIEVVRKVTIQLVKQAIRAAKKAV